MTMNPKRFLTIAGLVLPTIGILGILGVLGSISSSSFFNPPHWINWFHLSLGIFVLCVAVWASKRLQTGVTLVATVLGLTLGLVGLLFGSLAANYFNTPELADPSDHIAHLAVGLFAFWGWWNR